MTVHEITVKQELQERYSDRAILKVKDITNKEDNEVTYIVLGEFGGEFVTWIAYYLTADLALHNIHRHSNLQSAEKEFANRFI